MIFIIDRSADHFHVWVCLCAAVALPMVNDLELFDITHSTMRVRWRTAEGASGYMILYAPLTEGDPADEKEVSTGNFNVLPAYCSSQCYRNLFYFE